MIVDITSGDCNLCSVNEGEKKRIAEMLASSLLDWETLILYSSSHMWLSHFGQGWGSEEESHRK